MNQLGSRDEAEDAMQSTFLNAHRALQRGVTPEAELAWLFKIAHNVCLTRRRSTRRRGRVEAPSDLDAVQDLLPAPNRESADDLIRLTDALAHMPDNQRRAILLREWQGLSYHEIADELKLSQSAVETLIFRARRTLAANLETQPESPSLVARARAALDLGMLAAAAKALFTGSTAVKAAATAVAVSGAAVVATVPPERPAKQAPKPTPALVEQAPTFEAQVPAVQSVALVETHRAVVATTPPAPKREAAKQVAPKTKAPAQSAAAPPTEQPAVEQPAAAAPPPAPAAAPPAPVRTEAPAAQTGRPADKPKANDKARATEKKDKPRGQDKSKAQAPTPVAAPPVVEPVNGGKAKEAKAEKGKDAAPGQEKKADEPVAEAPVPVAPPPVPAEGDKGGNDKENGRSK